MGGGVETQLMDELFLRAEYLHGFYASRSYLDGLLRVAPDSDEFRLGLIYRPDATAGNAQPPTIATSTPAWNGFYGVALAGSQNINTQIGSAATLLAQGLNSQGGAIAAVAGYGQIVDAEYLSAEAEAGASRAGGALSFDGNTVARLSYNSQYALRGRVGALLSPDTMVSAAAGWSWAGASASSGVPGPSSHVFFNGPQIGVGLDAMLSAQVGARLEYLQTFYGPQGSLSATPAAGLSRAGLLLHF